MPHPKDDPTPSPGTPPSSTTGPGTAPNSSAVFATISAEDWRRSLASVGQRKRQALEDLKSRLSSPVSPKYVLESGRKPRKSKKAKELEKTRPLLPDAP